MEVDYGLVNLKVADLTRWEREGVWSEDQEDLLFIRQRLGFACTYAYGAPLARMDSVVSMAHETRSSLAGTDSTDRILLSRPRGDAPTWARPHMELDPVERLSMLSNEPVSPATWHAGPETDADLRLHLMRPRQKLIVWATDRRTGGRIRWLESPRPGFAVDLAGGPRPLACDVVSVTGEPTTVGVHFQVETHTSPCPTGADRVILSHRWEMSHEPNEDHYLSRIVKGTVVFNASALDQRGLNPDSFRNQLIPPVPVGFRREPPKVWLSSDGHVLKYVCIDTDPTITFDPGNSGATRLEIAERITYNVPWAGLGEEAESAVEQITNTRVPWWISPAWAAWRAVR